MIVFKAYDLFKFKTISSRNNQVWKAILNKLGELPVNEQLLVDFEGIELEDPIQVMYFQKAFTDERLYLKIYNNEPLKDTLDFFCETHIPVLKSNRVTNIQTKEDKPVKKSRRVETQTAYNAIHTKIEQNIDNNRNNYTIKVYRALNQISYEKGLDAIQDIVNELKAQDTEKDIIVDFGDIHIVETLVPKLLEFKDCRIESSNTEIMEQITLLQYKKVETVSEKVRILRDICGINTVGMMKQYKATKGTDRFGRCGKGEILSYRPAILRNIKSIGNEVYCVFEVFEVENFLTNSDRLARGEEPISALPITKKSIHINELGYDNQFLGKLYHFEEPIHAKGDELYQTYRYDGIGYIEKYFSLPQYIKVVLDEFKVNYDATKLLKAIGKSRNNI